MQVKNTSNINSKKRYSLIREPILSKKVDINILLNRVKIEKKSLIKKNLIITFGALGTLAITGLITIL